MSCTEFLSHGFNISMQIIIFWGGFTPKPLLQIFAGQSTMAFLADNGTFKHINFKSQISFQHIYLVSK